LARNFDPASTIVSDGLRVSAGVGNAGPRPSADHHFGSGLRRGRPELRSLKWVNTTLGNIKSAITGTYRAVPDNMSPLLAEFVPLQPANDLAAMMPRPGYVAVRSAVPTASSNWLSFMRNQVFYH
jgi:hypothetical protein